MRLLTVAVCILASWAAARWTLAATPGLIDRPSPPPCAADGTCYPNAGEWGYYPVRWRTWPGVALEPVPMREPTPEEQLGPELSPHETPPAELEDVQAPPGTTKRPPPAGPAVAPPAEGEATPEDGGAPAAPGQQPFSPPAAAPMTEPGADADPPPALPLSISQPERPTASATRIRGAGPVAPKSASNDPPPAPPWTHRASL